MNRIITSLLETDLYKFSMGQAIFHQFPGYETTWSFKCRNSDVKFTTEMVLEIQEQLKAYCDLRFTEDELQYLQRIPWLKRSYIDFLRLWKPRYEDFKISLSAEGQLSIEAVGTWLNTSMYEIPTLAIVNEVYFFYSLGDKYEEATKNAIEIINAKKMWLATNVSYITFSEFGLRRRFSAQVQEEVVKTLMNDHLQPYKFVGTSNVYLAKKLGIKPVGTMAHEFMMCVGQGDPSLNPAYSNKFAMEAWVKEYGVENGIMLTDTITTDCFLKDFTKTYATLFNGVRHDSGDPKEWGDKIIKHYEELGIDPLGKTLLFSDSLDFEKATALRRYFDKKINVAFGIGTWLSNDTGMIKPLNIVMKVTEVNGKPAAKISDTPGKGMCKDQGYVDYLQRTIDWRLCN